MNAIARARIRIVLRILLGGLFLIAGVLKAIDPARGAVVLDFLAPRAWSAPTILAIGVMVLASWECALGVWLLSGESRAAAVAAGATLLAFSLVLALLAASPDPPSCGCFGALLVGHARLDAGAGLLRNAALLWIALFLARHLRPRAEHRRAGPRVHACRGARRTSDPAPSIAPPVRGFTLVEVLVVILVAAILMSLLLPSLAGAKGAARSARSLSMHRQLLAVLSFYAADFRDMFPYNQTPGDPDGPLWVPPGIRLPQHPGHAYFTAGSWYWPNVLRPAYLDGQAARESGLPGAEDPNKSEGLPPDTIRARFWLAHAVYTDARYWHGDEEPPFDKSHFRAARHSEILHPARKALLLDILGGAFDPARRSGDPDLPRFTGNDALVGRADGSAGVLFWVGFDPETCVSRGYGARPMQVLATRDGLHGVDFK